MTPPLPLDDQLEKPTSDTDGEVADEQNSKEGVKCSAVSVMSTHLLAGKWMLWHLKGDSDAPWEQRLRPVARIASVEQFWALYNFVQTASSLPAGSDYYFFRDGIRPMWEDASNILGGRWQLKLPPKELLYHGDNKNVDWYWRELLMAMIGEEMPHSEHVCGVVANIRVHVDGVALWTRDAQAEAINKELGATMAVTLRLPATAQLRYDAHSPKTLGRRGGVMYTVNGIAEEIGEQ